MRLVDSHKVVVTSTRCVPIFYILFTSIFSSLLFITIYQNTHYNIYTIYYNIYQTTKQICLNVKWILELYLMQFCAFNRPPLIK